MIKYERAPDVEALASSIVSRLGMRIAMDRIRFVRSRGSESRRTIARCHAMSRIMAESLNLKSFYVVEVISEKFDRLSGEDQAKTMIHELMHIPSSMGGGFRGHRSYVNRANVDLQYRRFINQAP